MGWPLQYRVTGPDKDEVRRIALEVAQIVLARTRARGTFNFDWMEPARQVRVHVDQDEARRLGVSSRAIGAVLNASVTGSTVTQVRDDIYLVNVVARATDDQRVSFETPRARCRCPRRADAWCRCAVRDASPRSRNSRSSGDATACPR